MNKTAIKKTAVLSKEDGCFVFESTLLPNCIGAARTREEAWEHFVHHVDDTYVEYLEGRLASYAYPGRPSKSLHPVSLRVKEHTKKVIAEAAEEIECSQGEFVDYLVAFWEAGKESQRASGKKRRK
ncbi:MAG: hypothetical protein SFY67_14020 [Candidatus Melainabacteria bacterium]|nr:hypothetical protein [Candidatus Melainabacteria bacterium]